MKNSINDTRNNDEIANLIYSRFPMLPDDIPIAYKAKKWFFYELPFFVNKSVLVPRFETEILVREVLYLLNKNSVEICTKKTRVIDVCTGSGCIATAIAKNTNKSVVYACDISKKALCVAKKNARYNKVKINFFKSDLFENASKVLNGKQSKSKLGEKTIKNVQAKFDIIVSNPPYIKTSEIGKYDKSVLNEPRIALDGGEDGLCFYRRLACEAFEYLTNGGSLFLEIGHDQGEDVENVLRIAGFNDINIIKDQDGHDRVIKCKKN